jgi:hypothetical protein
VQFFTPGNIVQTRLKYRARLQRGRRRKKPAPGRFRQRDASETAENHRSQGGQKTGEGNGNHQQFGFSRQGLVLQQGPNRRFSRRYTAEFRGNPFAAA